MRKLMMLVSTLAILALPAIAGDFPKAEVFGGYQYSHFGTSANGWNTAITGNLTRSVGITGDFSGSYKSGSSLYTYMAGPVFSARTEHVTPFVHALFGGASIEGTGVFAMAFGRGVDVNAGKHLAIRLVQGDWMVFRSGGTTSKGNGRVSTGIVLRF